jgi:hypothetical protein
VYLGNILTKSRLSASHHVRNPSPLLADEARLHLLGVLDGKSNTCTVETR